MFKQIKINFKFNHFVNYLFFSISNAIISVCTIILLARYLTPEEFGKFGLLMTIVYFMPSLISFSTDSLQAIKIIELDDISYIKFRNNYISFVSSLFLIFLFLSFIALFNLFYFKLILFSLLIGFLQWLSSIHNNELLQKRNSLLFGILNLSNSILLILLSYILLIYVEKTWEYRAFAIILTELFLVILRLYFVSDIFTKFSFKYDKNVFYYFLKFGFPLLIAVVPGWILNQFDKYILINKYDYKVVGYYTFAASMSGIIVILSQSLQKSIRPLVYNELYLNGNIIKYRDKILKYVILIILLSVLIGLLILFFFNRYPNFKYSSSRYLIFFAIISQAFFSIYGLLVMVLEYFKKNRLKSRIIWEAAILFILINFFIDISFYIPAIATLISFIFLSFKTYLSVKEFI